MRDLLGGDDSGVLVSPDDLDALAAAIVSLARDRRRREEIGRRARDKVLQDYVWDEIALQYLQIATAS
jgi:glycosyltransferase involved in cell wall biosynthesis